VIAANPNCGGCGGFGIGGDGAGPCPECHDPRTAADGLVTAADYAEQQRQRADRTEAALRAVLDAMHPCDRQCGSVATATVWTTEGAEPQQWCDECCDINEPWGRYATDLHFAVRKALELLADQDGGGS